MLPYRYPEECQTPGGNRRRVVEYGVSFVRAMEEYGGSYALATCTEPWLTVESTREDLYDHTPVHWSYAYYGNFIPEHGTGPRSPHRVSDAVDDQADPQTSVLVADANRFSPYPTGLYGCNHWDMDFPTNHENFGASWGPMRGPLGLNVCYIDVHVRWLPWSNVSQDSSKTVSSWIQNYFWEE